LNNDLASMSLNDSQADGQAETRPFSLGREQRLEEFFHVFGRYPCAAISKEDQRMGVRIVGRPIQGRGYLQLAAGRHRLDPVVGQIDYDLAVCAGPLEF